MNRLTTLDENAKQDWLKLVKKHKKKQKGLALTTLNPNAGNVEHNINMFNMMQPDGSVSVDASNGNVCCSENYNISEENIMVCENYNTKETVDLEYTQLEIEPVVGSWKGGYFDPPEEITKPMEVDWIHEVDEEEVISLLYELYVTGPTELGLPEDASDEAIEEAIRNNVDELVEKYSEQLKEYFVEDAVDSATKYYSEHYSSGGYEPEPEDYYRESLDDSFDMSMRTLL